MSALLCLWVLAAPPQDRQLIDRIVAVVNQDIITLSELESAAQPLLPPNATEQMRTEILKRTLDQLIREQLLAQQMKEAKIEISDAETDRAVQMVLTQNRITMDELVSAIRTRGMSLGQYKEDIKSQLRRQKLIELRIRQKVVVPESEIRQVYEERTRNEPKREYVRLRHIYLSFDAKRSNRTEIMTRAKGLRERLLKGEKMAELAKAESDGPTATEGGEMGELELGTTLPSLRKAVAKLKKGAISQPIETDNGVHIVQLEGRRFKGKTSYESMRNQLFTELHNKESQRQLNVWLDEVRSKSAVDVRL